MILEHEFTVPAPVEEVWKLLLDLERVAPCLPGGQVTERVGDSTYKASVAVKLGPMNLTYRGQVAITDSDESTHRAVMEGRASETRGQGTAKATITTTLEPDGSGTHARMVTDLQLTGRVAQMGRGIVKDVSDHLMGEFATCLSRQVGSAPEPARAEGAARQETPAAGAAGTVPAASPPAAQPISGFALILRLLRSRLSRLTGRR